MRILIVGDWHSELHEEVMAKSLRSIGHEVFEFKWCAYFRQEGLLRNLWLRFQNKYLVGPRVARLNRDLLRCIQEHNVDLVFVYRGTHILKKTIRQARAHVKGAVFIGYNNDDPFGPGQPAYLWRHFLSALPEYDLVLAYRHVNLSEYLRAGARRVELLRSWFVPERNHPIELSAEQSQRFKTDVVFVGHYEPDQRLEYLERLVERGIKFRLFGPGYDWDPVLKGSSNLREQVPVRLVWGQEYNLALAGAKIALCFFSKLNRDTYTRRCFEIPASGTLLLSEYSDDMAEMFREGIEADYFRSPEEMVTKVHYYLANEDLRKRVAAAGRSRVVEEGHDIDSRMAKVVGWVEAIAAEKAHSHPST